MPLHPRTCSFLYSVSCLLDALDGYAARIFEQSTRFGAILDMVTDRCTTSCLLVFLSSAFPRWAILFQCLISLDFASHYMHMYSTLVVGGADSSHKNIDKSQSRLLNLYYSNKVRGRVLHLVVAPQLTGILADCLIHLLHLQRALLHRALPPIILVAPPIAQPDQERPRVERRHRPARCARQCFPLEADVPRPVQRRCPGDGSRQ